jgi:phage regulator Rha-like protein
MFQLTKEEYDSLRSQFATLKQERGRHRKYLPYAFTEHGAIMAATILNSPKAIEMSVFVVRAFVKLREILSTNKELIHKLNELDKKYEKHDKDIKIIIETIRQLMAPPDKPERKIGFKT